MECRAGAARGRLLAVLLAVVVAACSPQEGGAGPAVSRGSPAAAAPAGSAAAAPEREATVPPAPAPVPDPGRDATPRRGGGPVVVENWELTEVQVRNDGLGDFRVDAVMTNISEQDAGCILTAYLFSSGNVVGTATGTMPTVGPGESAPIVLRGMDDYTDDWDDLTFRVDASF